jgi:hypothetical protein
MIVRQHITWSIGEWIYQRFIPNAFHFASERMRGYITTLLRKARFVGARKNLFCMQYPGGSLREADVLDDPDAAAKLLHHSRRLAIQFAI